MARSIEGLEETKAAVTKAAPGCLVHCIQADLGRLESLQDVFSRVVECMDKQEQCVLIHNAASLGHQRPVTELTDPQVIQNYLALNYTSMFTLTALFLSCFTQGHRMVVNITSLLSRKFMPGFSEYTPGKAARNAFTGVLAVENPSVRTFSYIPGSVDTEMLQSCANDSYSGSVCSYFKQKYDKKLVFSTAQSVSVLVKVMEEDSFKSGDIVDIADYLKLD